MRGTRILLHALFILVLAGSANADRLVDAASLAGALLPLLALLLALFRRRPSTALLAYYVAVVIGFKFRDAGAAVAPPPELPLLVLTIAIVAIPFPSQAPVRPPRLAAARALVERLAGVQRRRPLALRRQRPEWRPGTRGEAGASASPPRAGGSGGSGQARPVRVGQFVVAAPLADPRRALPPGPCSSQNPGPRRGQAPTFTTFRDYYARPDASGGQPGSCARLRGPPAEGTAP
jgi:hypothetical protein